MKLCYNILLLFCVFCYVAYCQLLKEKSEINVEAFHADFRSQFSQLDYQKPGVFLLGIFIIIIIIIISPSFLNSFI